MDLLPGALRLSALAAGIAGILCWLLSRYLARPVKLEALTLVAAFSAVAGFQFAFSQQISLSPLSLPESPLTKLPYLLLLALAAGYAASRYPKHPNAILSGLALVAVFWCAAPYVSTDKIRVALIALLGVAAAQALDMERLDGARGGLAALIAALAGMALVAMMWGSHLGTFALSLAAALTIVMAASGSPNGPILIAPALAGWMVIVTGVAMARPVLLIPAALSAAPLVVEPSIRSFFGAHRRLYWIGLGGLCAAEIAFALVFVSHNL